MNRKKRLLKIKKMETLLLSATPKQAGKLAKKLVKEKSKVDER